LFINIVIDFIKFSSTNKSVFDNFMKNYLCANNLIDTRNINNLECINSTFVKDLRNLYIKQVFESSTMVKCEQDEDFAKVNGETQFRFRIASLPKDIQFDVVSLDNQQSLWMNPSVENGKEYIKFLAKRVLYQHFNTINANIVYMNYDLPSVVKSSVPKSAEHILFQHYKRVSGTFRYMLSYVTPSIGKIEWTNFGFEYDSETLSFNPLIHMKDVPKNPEKEKQNTKSSSNITAKTVEQKQVLQQAFDKNPKLLKSETQLLAEKTGLTKQQIQCWFSKNRKKRVNIDKENVVPVPKKVSRM